LIKKLRKLGADVSFNDPFVPEIRKTREHGDLAGMKSVEIDSSFDLLLLLTDHDEYKSFDFTSIDVPLVDTRNCVNAVPANYLKA